jgi:PAS domain S-box-containing protein
MSQASHLLLSISRAGVIQGVDRLNPKVLGRTASQIKGQGLADLMAPGERKHFERVLERCDTGESVWDRFVFLTADGRRRPVLCCLQPLKGRRRQGSLLVTGLGMMAADASVRSEAAAALGRLAFRCHRPLHRLIQAIEVILEEFPASEAARRCREDLDDLIEELSRYAAWPPPEAMADQPVDVVRVLEGTLCLLDADPSYGDLQMHLRPDEASVWAYAHPVGLSIVALHLAANARDATAGLQSPRLNIDVHPRGEQAIVEFADNGRGMRREETNSAFSFCFTQAKGPEPRVGLGLATCQELVRFMGGGLRIQSHRRQGTTVSVTLRAAPALQ